MTTFFNKFLLHDEKEEHDKVLGVIGAGIDFRGTNLWILIFAIFVASLGLNVNSTAVIIGAMLISPLMGPIMGMGLALGINDLSMLRRAISNYLIATLVALTTSTFFFLVSPLNEAHSEILARTSPNIYDVLIALFGGLAGILATSSRQKGNVIPGVAIATALMPPLCTAGYGLATFQWMFFFGAFYLFVINTVFIALATFITVRLLHYPLKQMPDPRSEKKAARIVWSVVVVTILPSLYFGYTLVNESRFTKSINRFVAEQAVLKDDYLLSKKIDAGKKHLELVFGGRKISPEEIDSLRQKLVFYGLKGVTLEVRQGFSYLAENPAGGEQPLSRFSAALDSAEKQRQILQSTIDSFTEKRPLQLQIYAELKVRYPSLKNAVITPVQKIADSAKVSRGYIVMLDMADISSVESQKLKNWIKVRLRLPALDLVINRKPVR